MSFSFLDHKHETTNVLGQSSVLLDPQECGLTLAHDVFEVDFSVSLEPLPLQSVHDCIGFSAASSVAPVMLSWDFGDLSLRVNATGSGTSRAGHKYGVPGRYAVGLVAWAGHKEVREAPYLTSHLFVVDELVSSLRPQHAER